MTIYHADYDGHQPYNEIFGEEGSVRRRLTRTTAYCSCTAGTWIETLHRQDATDVYNRMYKLDDLMVNQYRTLWSPIDPTAEYCDPGEVPDWKEFRRQLACNRVFGRLPEIVPDPRREEAYAEMGEAIPGREANAGDDTIPF